MVRPAVLAVTAALALVVAGAAAASGGATAHAQILSLLNAERAASGIPGPVREDATWSAGCARHVASLDATGILAHTEAPANAAYSAAGSWAGAHSVLAMGSGWAGGDPFATAPLHLIQLMSPELRRLGLNESPKGTVCMTTFPGYAPLRLNNPVVYSVPGNRATRLPYSATPTAPPCVP